MLAEPSPPLGDDVVALRRILPTDAAEVSRISLDPRLETAWWFPVPHRADPRVVADLVDELESSWGEPGRFGPTLVAHLVGAPATIVAIVHPGILEGGVVEVGYGVAPDHRRQGIGTRVLSLVTDWLVAQGITAVVRIAATNVASVALAERCGYLEVGRERRRVKATGERFEAVVLRRQP